MTRGDAKRPGKQPLIRDTHKGPEMLCPRCKRYRSVLDYDRLEQTVEYYNETHAIYKCPKARGGCSFIFSPAPPSIMESMF